MKRLCAALLALLLIFTAAGCGKNNNEVSGSDSDSVKAESGLFESDDSISPKSSEEKPGEADGSAADFTASDMQGVWIDDLTDPCLVLYVGSDLSYELDYAKRNSEDVYIYEGKISFGGYEKADDSFVLGLTYTDDDNFSGSSDIGSYLITGYDGTSLSIKQLSDEDNFFSVNFKKTSAELYKYQ